jgi:ATP adenylyltransferase
VPDFTDLLDDELLELMKLTRRCQQRAAKVMQPHGFNIGVNLGKVAGAGIQEHCTSTSCRAGRDDSNFMPVIANTDGRAGGAERNGRQACAPALAADQ